MEPLFEKTDDFLQLTLDFVVIVLKPFSGRVVGVVEVGLEDVCTVMNPKGVDNTELVAYVVDKLVLQVSLTGIVSATVSLSEPAGVGLRVLWRFDLCTDPSPWSLLVSSLSLEMSPSLRRRASFSWLSVFF